MVTDACGCVRGKGSGLGMAAFDRLEEPELKKEMERVRAGDA
jgi:hypothetical protein